MRDEKFTWEEGYGWRGGVGWGGGVRDMDEGVDMMESGIYGWGGRYGG